MNFSVSVGNARKATCSAKRSPHRGGLGRGPAKEKKLTACSHPATGEGAPQRRDADHLPTLDGLRGFAALVVLASHLAQATGILAAFFGNSGGQIGVMLFFALSGFLMAHVYFERSLGGHALLGYAVARVARVVPLYLAVVLLSYLGTATGWFRAYPIDDAKLLAHLLFQSGESVLWTIPVELRFYVLFCLFWALFRLSGLAAAVAVAAILVAYYLLPPGGMPVMRLGHFFLIGLLAWFASGCSRIAGGRTADACFLLAAAVLALSFPLPFEAVWGRAPRIWWEPQPALAVFVFLATAVRSPVAARLLGSLPMRRVGDWSYSIYLTHMLTVMNLRPVLDPPRHPYLFVAVVVPLVLAQSALVRAFVERPCQAFLRRAVLGRVGGPSAERERSAAEAST